MILGFGSKARTSVLVERLSRNDTTAAIASYGRLVLPAQRTAGVALVEELKSCVRDGSGSSLEVGDVDQSSRSRQFGVSLKLGVEW